MPRSTCPVPLQRLLTGEALVLAVHADVVGAAIVLVRDVGALGGTLHRDCEAAYWGGRGGRWH